MTIETNWRAIRMYMVILFWITQENCIDTMTKCDFVSDSLEDMLNTEAVK